MPSNTYDYIALGDDLAGLIAATLLARQGHRVALVVSGTPDSYRLGPYTLPARPLCLAGYEGGAIKHVLTELHFQHPLKRRLGSTEPSFQLAMPGARLDVSADLDVLRHELARESGAPEELSRAAELATSLSSNLDPLLAGELAIPPVGFFERREVARIEGDLLDPARAWWDEASADPFARALFGAPAALSCPLVDEALTPVARLRAFEGWRRGAPRLEGDWRTLRETFLDKFDSHGGDVRIGHPGELTFGWGGKVTGLALDDGDELGCGHLLAALPIADLESLCGKHAKKLRPLGEQIELAGYQYVLNVVVDEAGVPEGMAHTLMYVRDPSAPLTGANAMLVHAAERDQDARVTLTITSVCPLRSEQTVERSFADLRVRLREGLEEIMPFVSEHVRLAHSPNERLPAEGPGGELELDEPLPPTPIWRTTAGTVQLAGLPYQLGLKNLTLCNSQILPGLGVEAHFAVGWQAARMAVGGGKKKERSGGSVLVND